MPGDVLSLGRQAAGVALPYFVVIRERGPAWDWLLPMRHQSEWDVHAAFMDTLADEGFILAGGPLGGEDDAARVLHAVNAPSEAAIEARLAEDPWTPMLLLRTVSLEPWAVLLGGFARAARATCRRRREARMKNPTESRNSRYR